MKKLYVYFFLISLSIGAALHTAEKTSPSKPKTFYQVDYDLQGDFNHDPLGFYHWTGEVKYIKNTSVRFWSPSVSQEQIAKREEQLFLEKLMIEMNSKDKKKAADALTAYEKYIHTTYGQ